MVDRKEKQGLSAWGVNFEGEEMAVHIQSCRQQLQSASHQSILGNSRRPSALETLETQDRGESCGETVVLVEELASKGIDTHMVWIQAGGLGAGF